MKKGTGREIERERCEERETDRGKERETERGKKEVRVEARKRETGERRERGEERKRGEESERGEEQCSLYGTIPFGVSNVPFGVGLKTTLCPLRCTSYLNYLKVLSRLEK